MSTNEKPPQPHLANTHNLNVSDDVMQQLDEGMGVLVLVSGTLKDGTDHYAYASMPPSKYTAFKEAEAIGNYNLAEYGKILTHGPGREPSAEVKQRMADEYGANHYLEEELAAMLTRLQKTNKPI